LEEECGYQEKARDILKRQTKGYAQGSVEIAVLLAAINLRAGQAEEAAAGLQSLVGERMEPSAKSFLVRWLASVYDVVLGSQSAAQKLYRNGWDAGCHDAAYISAAADFELRQLRRNLCASRKQEECAEHTGCPKLSSQGIPMDHDAVTQVQSMFQAAIFKSRASKSTECALLLRLYVDFLVALGAPIAAVRKAEAEALDYSVQSVQLGAAGKKRPRQCSGTEENSQKKTMAKNDLCECN